jgi:hypothetical protein
MRDEPAEYDPGGERSVRLTSSADTLVPELEPKRAGRKKVDTDAEGEAGDVRDAIARARFAVLIAPADSPGTKGDMPRNEFCGA